MNAEQFLHFANHWPEELVLLETNGKILVANNLFLDHSKAEPGESIKKFFNCSDAEFSRALRSWCRSPDPLPVILKWYQKRNQKIYAFLVPDDKSSKIVLRFSVGDSIVKGFMELNRELEQYRILAQRLSQSRGEIHKEREKAHVILRSIGDGVIATDANGVVEYLNPAAEQLTGWQFADAKGKKVQHVFTVVHEITRKTLQDSVSRCLNRRTDVSFNTNVALKSKDGKEFIIEDSATLIHNRFGAIEGAVLTFRDVTGDRLAQRQLEYLAQHDTLTSLKNRYYFGQQLDLAVKGIKRRVKNTVLLYIDLDEFKSINDTAGHVVGDEVLVEAAQRLSKRLRQGDVLARLGGDEFAVLAPNVEDGGIEKVAQGFVQSMQEFQFDWQGQSFNITCSVGAVEIHDAIRTPAEVVRQADIACYLAKQRGKNQYYVFSLEDDSVMTHEGEYSIVEEIQHAVLNDQLKLMVLPIVQIKDGEQTMCELLLRMTSRKGADIPAAKLIAIAERYGIVHKIDRWVTKNAIELIKGELQKAGKRVFAINLSGVGLGDSEILELLQKEINKDPRIAQHLVIEITETDAVIHTEKANGFVKILREFGVRFTLDDFGVGFSSFTYLKHLDVDYIKIDGTFVRDVVNDYVDQAMVRSVHQISQSLGKKTIAEFVENEHILQVLRRMGVDMAQGYFISEPLELDEIDN